MTWVFVLLLAARGIALDQNRPARSFIAADSSRQRIAIISESGATAWEYSIGPLHDLHVLPNGHVLFQTSWTDLIEVDPRTNRIVWQHQVRPLQGFEGRIEVHALQRVSADVTMAALSGPGVIHEFDRAGSVLRTIPLQVRHPDAHHDTRLVRKLANGNYLVCHENDGLVREYAADGRTVWEFEVPLFDRERTDGHGPEAFGNQCFSAIRLPDGNTLIGTGNGHSVLEVTPDGEIVWSVTQNELPGICLAWVTSLQVLAGGHVLINNCHGGPDQPQLIEIDRNKRVIWTFRDHERFGNSLTNSQMLSMDGIPVPTSGPELFR
jgi:outer membrane protein assembly factor BamB